MRNIYNYNCKKIVETVFSIELQTTVVYDFFSKSFYLSMTIERKYQINEKLYMWNGVAIYFL